MEAVVKRIISIFLSCLILASSLGNTLVFAADSSEEYRKKNLNKCIEQFLTNVPEDFKLKNISVIGSEELKQPAWLEDGIITYFVENKISIVEHNPVQTAASGNIDYIVSYKLVDEKKNLVKVAFKLIDGNNSKLVKYLTVQGQQPEERLSYDNRVAPAPYVKPQGKPWGLYIIIGALLAGYALVPKI